MKKTIQTKLFVLLTIMMFVFSSCIVYAESETLESDFKTGDYFLLGSYDGEPILWRGIAEENNMIFPFSYGASYNTKENNDILLFSDKILCFKEFDVADDKDEASNVWAESTLRAWLNSVSVDGAYDNEKGFLASGNFTKEERSIIKSSNIDVFTARHKLSGDFKHKVYANTFEQGRPHGNLYLGITCVSQIAMMRDGLTEKVQDKVFLLDDPQVFHVYAVFRSAAARLANPLIEEYVIPGYNHAYWLRTPYNERAAFANSYSKEDVCIISGEDEDKPYREYKDSFDRYIYDEKGDCYTKSDISTPNGVRPAFYIDIEKAVVLGGIGTEENPYVLGGKNVIGVYLNGAELAFYNEPMIKDGQVLVPLRAVFEALGAEVGWEDETQTVTAAKGKDKIRLKIGESAITKNDQSIYLGAPIYLEEGCTFIPLNAISESFSIPVEWDIENQVVTIISN